MAKSTRTRARSGSRRLPPALAQAVEAAQGKQASDVVALDLRKAAAFTDHFLLCTGRNVRQVRAIVDAIEESLLASRVKPTLVEGYERAEWVLMDFFDFVVHVFTPDTRRFYSLERLWGSAVRIEFPDRDDARTGSTSGRQV
jgi:ribosome-associated protein